MKGTIVYFVVSPVHMRNAALFARTLPNWKFRLTHEEGNPYVGQKINTEGLEMMPLVGNRIPDSLLSADVRAVIFSTVQPRVPVMNLLQAARQRGITTLAIEESNQIALNSGAVNNYLLPLDGLFVASTAERDGMLQQGLHHRHIEVTGWPFFHGKSGRVPPSQRRTAKQKLGLDPDRPVASISLTALHAAGESPAIRERQLSLGFAGLPSGFQLAIKPHPVEKLETLRPFVEKFAPAAVMVDGATEISEFLAASDVLLNRGVSHVIFEALFMGIPVVVLDTGVSTPFHGTSPELVARHPQDLKRICRDVCGSKNDISAYESFLEAHAPFAPEEALALTAERIVEAIDLRPHQSRPAYDWSTLALFQAWQGNQTSALEILRMPEVVDSDEPVAALESLVRRKAGPSDVMALASRLEGTFNLHILRCLWIDQLWEKKSRPEDWGLVWMEPFPPVTNAPHFLDWVRKWYCILRREGYHEAASNLKNKMEQDFRDTAGISKLLQGLELPAHSFFAKWRRLLDGLSRVSWQKMRRILQKTTTCTSLAA